MMRRDGNKLSSAGCRWRRLTASILTGYGDPITPLPENRVQDRTPPEPLARRETNNSSMHHRFVTKLVVEAEMGRRESGTTVAERWGKGTVRFLAARRSTTVR